VGAISIPLNAILPAGGIGCMLLATPDALTIEPDAAGMSTTSLAVPNAVALVGASLHHQIVALEFAPSGDFSLITSTNALALTIGVW